MHECPLCLRPVHPDTYCFGEEAPPYVPRPPFDPPTDPNELADYGRAIDALLRGSI